LSGWRLFWRRQIDIIYIIARKGFSAADPNHPLQEASFGRRLVFTASAAYTVSGLKSQTRFARRFAAPRVRAEFPSSLCLRSARRRGLPAGNPCLAILGRREPGEGLKRSGAAKAAKMPWFWLGGGIMGASAGRGIDKYAGNRAAAMPLGGGWAFP
jgi:hypothetical protein